MSGLAEALASVSIPSASAKQPDEFTVEEAAEESGAARYTTLTHLKRLIKLGKASRRPAIVNGRVGHYYRLV